MSPEAQPLAVIAIGGNALAPAGEKGTIYDQFRHTRASLGPVVDLALDGWNVCLVHGNGPQVGDELLRNELARAEASPLPLGVLVASTAGWIGYMIQQSLLNALRRQGSSRDVATVITQTHVAPDDDALRTPTKYIGHAIAPERARQLAAEGYAVKQDDQGHWRRLVASPHPYAVHELATIRLLVRQGTIVVACGGGGAPVYYDNELQGWEGVDAVVDKDLVAAVLARDLGAELLLILTNVDGVYLDWGKPTQRLVPHIGADAMEAHDRAGQFGEGSMAPKVRAAVDYVRRTGGRAVIAELSRGRAAVRGNAGTTITMESA